MHTAQELVLQGISADLQQLHMGLHSFTGQKSLQILADKLTVTCTHRC